MEASKPRAGTGAAPRPRTELQEARLLLATNAAERQRLYSKVPLTRPRQAINANSTSAASKKRRFLEVIKCKMEGKEVRLAAGDSVSAGVLLLR